MMDKLMRSLRPRRVAVTATAPVARRERVERLLMGVVMIGSVVQLVAGNSYDQSQKLTACDTGVHNCYQTRQIAPNMWGLIVTLVSLTTDAWGFASSSEFAWRLLLVFVAGPIMPVWSLIEVLGKAFVGMTLTSKLGRSTLTVAKSNSANIIAQCDVLLGMRDRKSVV